jgi:hypothetical protein
MQNRSGRRGTRTYRCANTTNDLGLRLNHAALAVDALCGRLRRLSNDTAAAGRLVDSRGGSAGGAGGNGRGRGDGAGLGPAGDKALRAAGRGRQGAARARGVFGRGVGGDRWAAGG